MAEFTWSDRQLDCIEAKGGSVLVSAAAGSGKTAVLVERVIRRITDEKQPVDINRLLIVTFTRAAAAEMRQRLGQALAAKMEEEPENRLYQRQQMLLPQASISTVHGFCAHLLQENAAKAGLPVGFKVAEEAQTKLLAEEAMDTVLEAAYRKKDPAFIALANQLNSQRNDRGLREAVEETYDFMEAQPFPQQWLRQQMDAYSAVVPLEKTAWMRPILKETAMLLEYACLMADKAAALSHTEGLEPHRAAIEGECNRLHTLYDQLSSMTYDELYEALVHFPYGSLGRVVSKDTSLTERRDEEKKLRDSYKKTILKAAELYCGTEKECREDMAAMAPLVEALGSLTESYKQTFIALKREHKLLDYDDLEQESLRLLLDEETGRPTALAEEISRRYEEIMVDEYQDTNMAQDTLFRALSRNEENLFTVGDVKQSIYGFRQARPEIFTARRDSYTPYDREHPVYPATITLEQNYRSRHGVTSTVNFLFRQMMGRSLGGVDYRCGEELVYAANYNKEEDAPTTWLIAGSEDPAMKDPEREAYAVAGEILELMKTAVVQAKTGPRPITWSDICILMRSRKKFPVFYKVLESCGIPVAGEKQKILLDVPEVRSVLSLLRCVDNPLRDVDTAAAMASPLYGFTPDDLALLRLSDPDVRQKTPLYVLTERYARQAADPEEPLACRCRAFMKALQQYRRLAVFQPADRLLETIYQDTGAVEVFSAAIGGRQKAANLQQLDRLARGFEQGGFRGLSAFVRYVDRMEETGNNVDTGSTQGADGVKLMTMHGSKGLEFPVVFIAGLTKQTGNTDSHQKILFHADAGIGLRLVDEEELEKHKTLPFAAVEKARWLDECAEDFRVWYVAMTRARERLYLVIPTDDLPGMVAKAARELPPDDRLLPYTSIHALRPIDVLLAAALRHPDFVPFRGSAQVPSLPADCRWEVACRTVSAAKGEAAQAQEAPAADPALTALWRQRLGYVYPYEALQGIPAKLAASQLSHQAMSRDFIGVSRPAFLQKAGMTAAQKGTAMHTFMQFANYGHGAADLEGEILRLLDAGFLTKAQADSLNREQLTGFFTGSLYARMAASPHVWREYAFTLPVKAGTLAQLPEAMAEETVVVQGIADCVFQEGSGLVLVDYKTDHVKEPAALIERYRSQMAFYREALPRLLGMPVTETVLYSFSLGTCVNL